MRCFELRDVGSIPAGPAKLDYLGVTLVLAVSTSDCDSDRMDSNSIRHP